MLQLDVLEILQKMSPKEVKSFHGHLKNKWKDGRQALNLFAYLRKHHPKFDERKVSYAKATKYIGVVHDESGRKIILNALSDIRLELRDYLIEAHVKSDAYLKGQILLQVYGKYRLNRLFEKQLRSLEKGLKNETQKDLWYDFKEMQVAHERYFHVGTKQFKNRSSIYAAMNHLDRFYAAAKLTYASEIFNGMKILAEEESEIYLLPEIMEKSWEEALQMRQTGRTELYFLLKEQFVAHHKSLLKKHQFVIMSYLLNHTSKEVSRDREDFIAEHFELMRFGMDHQVFIIDGVLEPNHFLNAIEVAGRLEHFDWAWDLISSKSKYLVVQTRDYYKSLGIALIHFKKKNYEICSDLLSKIEISHPHD